MNASDPARRSTSAAEVPGDALLLDGLCTAPGPRDRGTLAALPGGLDDIAARVPGRRGRAAPLAPLLDLAAAAARHVWLESRDGSFRASLSLAEARCGWIVHELDGAPLPAEFGGPFRLFFPGVDACANLKDVARITLAAEPGDDSRPRRGL